MSKKQPPLPAPVCPYCDRKAQLVHGKVIYPYRPDLFGKHSTAAMHGLIACDKETPNPISAARWAYLMADAMLEERAK